MNQAIQKHFIEANELLVDSFRLAKKIHSSGFKPDIIVGVWRGGTPIAIAVQEYFEYMQVPTDHIAIRTSSYFGIDKQDPNVKVHGLDYLIENVSADYNILLVDDVFDSGRSVKAIYEHISIRLGQNTPYSIKTACPWYKPKRNQTDISPDFYLHETDDWLVFPHELIDLSTDEIKRHKAALSASLLD